MNPEDDDEKRDTVLRSQARRETFDAGMIVNASDNVSYFVNVIVKHTVLCLKKKRKTEEASPNLGTFWLILCVY